MRHFLSLTDWDAAEVADLLELARRVKGDRELYATSLAGRGLGLLFLKSSTRTRVSFEVGIRQLGGFGLFLTSDALQMGRGETLGDTARTLSCYLDLLMVRLFAHQDLLELAASATIPVINGLTDEAHPCQALADLLTLQEEWGTLEGRKLAYLGDGNNVAHSLMMGAAKLGLRMAVASPEGYEVDARYLEAARQQPGAAIELTDDPRSAVADADAVYTDVWTSMGQDAERERRLADLRGFGVDQQLMEAAAPGAIFLHCLPCHRGEEVTAEVVDGPQSRVWRQAENRLHAQKAIMLRLAGVA